MDLKFYLNKFLKVDHVEVYTLSSLLELRKRYEEFLENSKGIDPDFPSLNFGDTKKGEKVKGINPNFGKLDGPPNDPFGGDLGIL